MGIKITNLTKQYDSFGTKITALDCVNLAFNNGELVAIIGESGSGKTTLLNQLCGMDVPDKGEIIIDEINLTKLSSNDLCKMRRSKIGVVYQFYNLIPELNIRDNITLPVELDGGEIDEDELSEILKTVGLFGRERDFPSALSGGQQQRVAIARALFQKPALILADEPTGNLDEKNSEDILGLLCKLNEEKKITVIIVTHSKVVADRAGRLISLKNGQVISDEVR
ncbi:MAG: ABC transporter ATP-binding protein [Clostridia bacterium]|nr:ABC transporter ATP-binding protein [Clostridia bacterium]MBR3806356.1 ABC transporter ATP-binding protein [Clostridia bacterium]